MNDATVGNELPATGGDGEQPLFAPAGAGAPAQHEASRTSPPWTVAVIDDDKAVHSVSRLVLGDSSFKGRPLRILSEYSGDGARRLLRDENDISVLLLDVV
ncbi:MAG: hypothetical protein OEW21_03935, partial [Betaproteobacteria bacterium]|nr:hypothetical protein [Betaproteobacteria bacterium]